MDNYRYTKCIKKILEKNELNKLKKESLIKIINFIVAEYRIQNKQIKHLLILISENEELTKKELNKEEIKERIEKGEDIYNLYRYSADKFDEELIELAIKKGEYTHTLYDFLDENQKKIFDKIKKEVKMKKEKKAEMVVFIEWYTVALLFLLYLYFFKWR
jgi:uncharacterized NAD-dependent epimerase/dehydratase family protein